MTVPMSPKEDYFKGFYIGHFYDILKKITI